MERNLDNDGPPSTTPAGTDFKGKQPKWYFEEKKLRF